ncbi:MAG TPA: beta-galactosidase [Steroidobacteraceae bacterium]|nr:beta-galactosidase [Steroidobacteraceae bacterium]
MKAIKILLSGTVLSALCSFTTVIASDSTFNEANSANRLFVGTCYQLVDRTREQIHQDITLMKEAGFNVVRMGDLSWDYFEPADGKFNFKEFDSIMDEMHANGIKVILDIPGLPAPMWLHHKYPGVDLVTQNGTRLYAAERYMDDISDPNYQRLARRLAEKMISRYAHHPAFFAVGYDNEIGNGFMSYSKADRQRFIKWLKKKYVSLDALNKAWATQRWSRRIGSWDEVELPYADGPGPFERYLDLRRYWSDVTIDVLKDLEAVRRKYVPEKPAISNLWDSSMRKGFDYLSTQREYVTHGAMGFYPGEPVAASFEALMMKGGLSTPIWFNEFTAGGGGYYGTKGRSRMWAYVGLIDGAQALLAWTFNSHLGGEEQALFGLIDHDDRPSWKLSEFATIASEFNKLQSLGFPRIPKPQVAISYSFESRLASSPNGPSNTVRQYITTPYMDQKHHAFEPLFNDNIDVAVINVAHEDLSRYKLIVLPGEYLLDSKSIAALRNYVANGGVVVMTAFSAKVNDNNQFFNTPLPGGLSDVFGLRTNEFYNAEHMPSIAFANETVQASISFYEVLEPTTAITLARFTNVDGNPPAITSNQYGKGRAIYVAVPAQTQIMRALYKSLYSELGIEPGPVTPSGVYARSVDDRVLYVNTTAEEKIIPLTTPRSGLLSGKQWKAELRLGPYGVDLLQ